MDAPKVLTYPDARLRTKSSPVELFNSELEQLLLDLQYHLENGPASVGIAAPQIGKILRVAIVDVSSTCNAKRKRKLKSSNNGRLFMINPVITSRSGEAVGREGCLSIPDYTGNVARSESLSLSMLDETGAEKKVECYGFEARAVQHELDHLDGILFLDRVVSPREVFRRKTYK